MNGNLASKEWLKRAVLDSGLVEEYRQAHREAWKGDLEPQEAFRDFYGQEFFEIARNFAMGQRKRAQRCKTRTGEFVEGGHAWFLTLTFRDEVLDGTSQKTRRVYVSRFLKSISSRYVANIDFGRENEREHYHAIVESEEKPNLEAWQKSYGFTDCKRVRSTDKDVLRTAKYTAKLSLHALKASTSNDGKLQAPRLIYSRNI